MANINAQQCETCHNEHNGVRIVLSEVNFCFNCHADIEVKNDPLDIPHTALAKNEQWNTCIQCHDFHGNHLYNLAQVVKDTIPMSQIIDYLQGGKDPFSDKKKFLPLSEEEWVENEKKY
jgi:predicted CXXCH cytochrome family protein